jgi:hypothetical protein
LTTRERILPYGEWTFRNCVTGSDQVKALIRYAGRHQGIFRYAILYPDTKKGRTLPRVVRGESGPGDAAAGGHRRL